MKRLIGILMFFYLAAWSATQVAERFSVSGWADAVILAGILGGALAIGIRP